MHQQQFSSSYWYSVLIFAITIIGLSGCSYGQGRAARNNNEESSYDLFRNQQYVVRADSPRRRNRLDVYTPKTKTEGNQFPVVIFVHGGSWQFGDKFAVNNKPEWLTKNGIALISINYRFYPDSNFDGQAADVASAVQWTKANAQRFNLDEQAIFLMGHSAGAHLVALAGTDPKYLGEVDMKLNDLAGVIPIDGGGLNVPLQIEMAESRANVQAYEKVFTTGRATQKKASPFFHLKSGERYPPFLIAHVASRTATKTQANEFAKQLNSMGGSAKVESAADKTHMTINRDIGTDGDATSKSIQEFIKKQLRQSSSSFTTISVSQTGGFAGVNNVWTISADGKRTFNKSEADKLSDEDLDRLKTIVSKTDWNNVPQKSLQKNTADDFLFSISIEQGENKLNFEIDGLSLAKQTALKQIVETISK